MKRTLICLGLAVLPVCFARGQSGACGGVFGGDTPQSRAIARNADFDLGLAHKIKALRLDLLREFRQMQISALQLDDVYDDLSFASMPSAYGKDLVTVLAYLAQKTPDTLEPLKSMSGLVLYRVTENLNEKLNEKLNDALGPKFSLSADRSASSTVAALRGEIRGVRYKLYARYKQSIDSAIRSLEAGEDPHQDERSHEARDSTTAALEITESWNPATHSLTEHLDAYAGLRQSPDNVAFARSTFETPAELMDLEPVDLRVFRVTARAPVPLAERAPSREADPAEHMMDQERVAQLRSYIKRTTIYSPMADRNRLMLETYLGMTPRSAGFEREPATYESIGNEFGLSTTRTASLIIASIRQIAINEEWLTDREWIWGMSMPEVRRDAKRR